MIHQFLVIGANFLSAGFSFAAVYLLNKQSDVTVYADYSLFIANATLIFLAINFGLNFHLPKIISSENRNIPAYLSSLAAAAPVLCFLLAATSLLWEDYDLVAFLAVGLTALSLWLAALLTSYMISIGRTFVGILLFNLPQKLLLIVIIIAFFNVFQIEDIALCLICLNLISVIYLISALLYVGFFKEFGQVKTFLFSVRVLWVNNLLYGLFMPLATIIINQNFTKIEVAVFSLALVITQPIRLIYQSLVSRDIAGLAKALVQDNNVDLKRYYHQISVQSLFMIAPFLILTMFWHREILEFFSAEFIDYSYILPLVTFYGFIGVFFGPNGTILNLVNRERVDSILVLIKLVVFLSSMFVLNHIGYVLGLLIVLEFVTNLAKNIALKPKLGAIVSSWPILLALAFQICLIAVLRTQVAIQSIEISVFLISVAVNFYCLGRNLKNVRN